MSRTVITGIGVVSPNGIGTEAYWAATRKGVNGIKRIERFDPDKYATRVAGVVEGFRATDYVDKRLTVQTDAWTWMAMAGAKMAFEDGGFEPSTYDPYRLAVITASSSGGNEFGQREIQNLWSKGSKYVGAYQSIAWFYAATTGQLSIKHGMRGPCGVVCSEQAGGIDAVAEARRVLARGEADAVLSGGTEAPVGPYALTCQQASGLLSEGDDPDRAYRPFADGADGYVPGEGGAILLLEELESAQGRGAHVYAEVLGDAATSDAHHPTIPAPDGRQYARAMRLALEDAGVEPGEVDAVFADGMANATADAAEVSALHEVFGGRPAAPVTAPKSMVGRLYAGGASLDIATAALAIRDGFLPPTTGTSASSTSADLDLVTDGREQPLRTVLVAARGTGGFNSAIVLRGLGQTPPPR